MSRTQVLRKLRAHKKNPEVFQAPSATDLVDLVFVVLSQVDEIDKAIKAGRLNGETPQPDKDYVSKATATKYLTDAVNKLAAKQNTALSETSSKLEQRVAQAIENIRNGEDGIVSEAEIERAAQIAYDMIEFPDFQEMIVTSVTANPTAVRDALELLTEEDDKLAQSAISGLLDDLKEIREMIIQSQLGSGSGISKNAILKLIEDNASGSGGHTIEDEGTALTQRSTLNFVGSGVTVTDDGAKTVVTVESSGDGDTTYINNIRIASTDSDDYETLSGSVDGVNTTFTVPGGVYATGKILEVEKNGVVVQNGSTKDWVELDPTAGTIDFVNAPTTGDIIRVVFIDAETSSESFPKIGWGMYDDSTHTLASPLAVNNSRVQLTIDGLGPTTETAYLPSTGDLWDTTNNKITLNAVGDSFDLRVDFKAKANSNNGYFDLQFDIGDGSPVTIVEKTLSIVKGINTEQRFSETISGFSLATFISNGGRLYVDTTNDGINLDVYDLAVIIKKTN